MTSRLSKENVQHNLDAGHQNLPWSVNEPSGFLAGIDFNAILDNPQAREIIQSLPVQPLYYGLKKKGLAECLAVLPLLSQDQVVRIVDFDCWLKGDLMPSKAFDLLSYFAAASDDQLYKRFAHLDEEYQLAITAGFFRVYEAESREDLADELQDIVYEMPCRTVFYEIVTENDKERQFLETLIDSAKEYNLRYAYSLLAHASHMPPGEQELLIKKFREARMEEEGFVPYDRSLELFAPFNQIKLLKKWDDRKANTSSGLVEFEAASKKDPFLDLVFAKAQERNWSIDEQYEIHQRLLWLANSLCSAAQVEAYDTAGLNRVLEQCKALVGLGLDYLSRGSVEFALDILKEEYPQNLFKTGLSLVDDLRHDFVESIKTLSWSGHSALERAYMGRRWGEIQMLLSKKSDWLGVNQVEVLKGLFNRFPMISYLNTDKQCIEFDTLKNLSLFEELKENVQAVSGAIYLAELAGVTQGMGMDKGLSDALSQVLLDNAFEAKEPSEAEKDSLLKADFMLLKSRYVAFSNALVEQLKESKSRWWSKDDVLEPSCEKSFKSIEESWDDLFGMLVEARVNAGEEL